jgi:PAS domain S-box-containing protein
MRRCPICARTFPAEERFCSVHGLPLVAERITSSHTSGELTGHVIDQRYRLAGVAGRGGMGVVYEADNLRIGRRCAVKVLHPETYSDPKMRMRLFREVQATARIRHPNVVEIFDYGDDEAVGPYLVMEFLDGKSLSQTIRLQAPLPLKSALKISVQLCAALTATHGQGVIHRDLKPSNIRILQSGLVKVLDFGLVKSFDDEPQFAYNTLTTAGMAFGTPTYMSPEQASFKPLDQRTDIYSLGIILFEMLVGIPPFIGENPMEIIDAQRKKPVPMPSTINPEAAITPELELLILKALSKDPNSRHQSMPELMDELYAVADLKELAIEEATQHIALHPKLTGPAELAAEEQDTQQTTGFADPILNEFLETANARMPELIAEVIEILHDKIPRYRQIPAKTMQKSVGLLIRAGLASFGGGPSDLPTELRALADERTDQQFTPSELIGALWMGQSTCRSLIRSQLSGSDEQRFAVEAELDKAIAAFMLKLLDYYLSSYHRRLLRLNDVLSRQNEELQELRTSLTQRVDDSSRQLAEAEQLQARVVETISSGLMLVERKSRNLLLFNRAMERLSGVSAEQVLGRPMHTVLRFVEGVPYDEFVEQVRLHGEVGLRKLWIQLPDGSSRAVYTRGQAVFGIGGKMLGTLFVVDDITERERIIESFSRYVSREVVEQILRSGGLQPGGEQKQAIILSIGICGLKRYLDSIPLSSVVAILSDYVRMVTNTVFHHGGVVDRIIGDNILVYFDDSNTEKQPAITAAAELIQRMEHLNSERSALSHHSFNLGMGVHLGDVLVLNVGGEERMVRTLYGEATNVATGLQEIAAPGEILVSAALCESLKHPSYRIANGPVVAIKGIPKPVEAFRLRLDPKLSDQS